MFQMTVDSSARPWRATRAAARPAPCRPRPDAGADAAARIRWRNRNPACESRGTCPSPFLSRHPASARMSGVPLAIPDGLAQSVDHGVRLSPPAGCSRAAYSASINSRWLASGSIRARAAGAVRAVAAISAGRPAISPACVLAPGEKQALTAFLRPGRNGSDWHMTGRRPMAARPRPDPISVPGPAARPAGRACRRPAGFLAL